MTILMNKIIKYTYYIMKKILTILVMILITATGCAQKEAKTATKMTEAEMQAALAPLFEKVRAIPEDDAEGEAKVKGLALDFIKNNKNEAGVYAIRTLLCYVMPTEELIKFVEADEYYNSNETITKAKKDWKAKLETSAGAKFKDFEATYEGKTTKLSDYVGKGKYVLVDFWASWCGPCKREIPNLIAVYNKFKGDKFEVLGVATWDEPAKTLEAINKLGINYPQMLNAQKAGSDAYGISGIPEIILFAPDGTIVERGLRGEAIEKLVAEKLK